MVTEAKSWRRQPAVEFWRKIT